MTPDFEKAAKDYANSRLDRWMTNETAFLAGCEHAYSIDKETIERLEKENEELRDLVYRALNCADHVHYLTIQEIKKELKALTPDN